MHFGSLFYFYSVLLEPWSVDHFLDPNVAFFYMYLIFSYFLFFCASIQAFIFFFFFLFKWGAHITHKSLFNRNLQNKTTQSAWKPNKKFTSRRDASFCPYLLFNGPPLFWCYNRKQNTSQGCTSLLIVLLFPFWTTASESETNMYLYTYI